MAATVRISWIPVLVLALSLGAAALASGGDVRFSLSLVTADDAGCETARVPERRIELPSGSRFRFRVEATTDLHLYLFLDDAEGTLAALRPGGAGAATAAAGGASFTIPGGTEWFTLDPAPGAETFLLFATPAPEPQLEAIARKAASGLRGGEREAALDGLRELRRARSGLAEPAEKPVPIAGVTRAAGEAAALPVRAEGFYSRTMRIEHK